MDFCKLVESRIKDLTIHIEQAHVFEIKLKEYRKTSKDYKTAQYRELLEKAYKQYVFINEIIVSAENKLEDGDLSELETIFAYIAIEIKYFRSGYRKEKLCRELKKIEFTQEQKEILAEIIAKQIFIAGREFQAYFKLIAIIKNEFRPFLNVFLKTEHNKIIQERLNRIQQTYFSNHSHMVK
jgi:hypothetical protein